MIVSELREYLLENSASGNKCNGSRQGHSYGHGRTLTFRIPRACYGIFHPRILAVLSYQEDECERLAERFIRKVLHRNRLARCFRISMASTTARRAFRECWNLREDISQWLSRSLEAYYPLVFIDCVRKRSTAS